MWHPTLITEQINYANQDLKWVVSSGEPLPDSYTLTNNPIPQLAALYFNSLAVNANNESSNAHYDYWKQQGYFDEMTLNLGYRYRMIEANVQETVHQGEAVAINLTIENLGYSSPYNYRKTEIVLRNTLTAEEYQFDLTENNDMRYWHTGVYQLDLSFEIPSDFNEGPYDVFLNFPDADTALGNNPLYSVQLANIDTWEIESGYNSLLFQLTVEGVLNTANDHLDDAPVIYPNPTSSLVYLGKASEWILMDTSGKLLATGYGVKINLERYDSGLYHLKIGNKIYKIVKN
jgi:hypothetical protein